MNQQTRSQEPDKPAHAFRLLPRSQGDGPCNASLRAGLICAGFGTFWILTSDWFASFVARDVVVLTWIQNVKGLLFVLAISTLVSWLTYRGAIRHWRAQLLLAQSEERFRRIYQRAPIACQALDLAGRILEVNEAWTQMLGSGPGERVGQPFSNLLESSQRSGYEEWLKRACQADGVSTLEVTVRTQAGVQLPIQLEARVISDDQTQHRQLHCVLHNLAEQQRAAAQLQQANTRFRSLFQRGPLPSLLVATTDWQILDVNDAFVRQSGFSREEALGRTGDQLGLWRSASERDQFIHQAQTEGGLSSSEMWLRVRDGSTRCYLVSGQLLEWGAERVMLLTGNDVSERKRVEQALQQSEAKFAAFMDHLPGFAYIKDEQRRHVFVNRSVEAQFGVPRQEWHGKTLEALFPGPYAALVRSGEEKLHLGAEALVFEEELPVRGAVRTFLTSKFVFRQNDAVFLGGISFDITERKRAEEALRISEERFREMAEHIEYVFWMSNETVDQMLYASPGYERIWGRSLASLYEDPHSFIDAIHPEDRARVVATLRQPALLAGTRFETEYRIIRPDQSVRWIRDRGFPILGSEGKLLRVVGIAEDITQQLQTERRIQEQAALLEQIRDVILVVDLSGEVIFSNGAAAGVWSDEVEPLVGRPLRTLLFQGDAETCQSAIDAAVERGEWSGELRCERGFGETLIFNSRWSVVTREDQPKCLLIVCTDITEKTALEARFLRAQRMESIGTLASGIAHDLNNILAPIVMSVNLLGHKLQDADDQVILSILAENANRGASIVRQLLTFGRGAEGERTELQPRTLLKELAKVVRETFPRSITLRQQIPADLWTIRADPTQIHQVLLNLCVNARDAMPRGGTLTLAAENLVLDEAYVRLNPEARCGPHVVLQVVDTGTGIAPELLDKIFDPFFTTKEPGKGTGLGLSTVLGIVQGHEGFVQVHSRLGSGTQFRVYLPALVGRKAEARPRRPESLPQGRGETVLLVDDEEPVRQVARRVLEANGYRVITAADGAEGLSCFRQESNAQIVLADVVMPILDGPAMIRGLRQLEPGLRVIAMSGLEPCHHEAAGMEVSADAFLHKPFTPAQLLDTVQRVLRASGTPPEASVAVES